MGESYFEPWIGKNFEKTRTLLMSESTYSWLNEEGEVTTPQPTHPEGSVLWNIDHFGHNRYFAQLNRALCNQQTPDAAQMRAAWDDLAYTVFVQESVGSRAGIRPTKQHWHDACSHFFTLIEGLRPLKVIITGKDMWNAMPETAVYITNDIQAYQLKDGSLVWCLAVPHPANRIQGFQWQAIGESIRLFRASTFPANWP